MKHIPSVIYKKNLSRSSIMREFFKKEKNSSNKDDAKRLQMRTHRMGLKK